MKSATITFFAVVLMFSAPMAALHADIAKRPVLRPNDGAASPTSAPATLAPERVIRPKRRESDDVPVARWDHRPAGRVWTRAAVSALKSHGKPILQTVPRDIDAWCPAYAEADEDGRAAFWAGFMSALAKHESTYKQTAVGGGGRWYGLLQILPATARGYKCTAPSREGLKHGPSNLSCAVRILAVVMPRDKVMASKDKRWRGVAADWGPMRVSSKRKDIAAWTRKQSYCRTLASVRPRARP
ncbi:transglycosylase SLT domain-containing protein [Planktotalea sp.]|uniref:transglycosylase SLT domain-containing protein n=1 Tax=Planktotalea sp. TaxID=2029877 RepID=UPI003C744E3F